VRCALGGQLLGYRHYTDGHKIAVAVVGTGPPLVVVPAWVTSIELVASGRDPRASLLERLARRTRLTLYDRLGTGLSRGPAVPDHGLAASAAELEAVLEGSTGPASVLGISQAGPIAVALAARRPDLVRRLVLMGTYADGPATFPSAELRDAAVGLVRAHSRLGTTMLAGPALVLHYRNDRLIPFRGGQQLAAGLPDAQFVALEGAYHLPDARDLDTIANAMVTFLRQPELS
jgi:pimeloyl-ACP methyl ester carboxylesterase